MGGDRKQQLHFQCNHLLECKRHGCKRESMGGFVVISSIICLRVYKVTLLKVTLLTSTTPSPQILQHMLMKAFIPCNLNNIYSFSHFHSYFSSYGFIRWLLNTFLDLTCTQCSLQKCLPRSFCGLQCPDSIECRHHEAHSTHNSASPHIHQSREKTHSQSSKPTNTIH